MATTTKIAGRWHHTLPDGRVQCDLCPRHCRLKDGQRAFCFVRERDGDDIVLTTYGRSSGFCIDPIEKKPLNHFLPGTPVLSFGTAGCNLGCRFCQNWSISKSRETDTIASVATPAAIARAARDRGCDSVAFTYNDPVLWAEYAIDTADACHELGLKTVAVTAGFIDPLARTDFFAAFDAANVDLKAFSDKFYKDVCLSKPGGLADVLDTLVFLRHETDVWFEITTLLIPDLNDSEDEIRAMCQWIAKEIGVDVPLHFTAFHPDFKLTDKPRTPPETLSRSRLIAHECGLHFVYTGNVHDRDGQTTRCPACHEMLIERNWYELGLYRLDQRGVCPSCDHPIAGVFRNKLGTWGARRQPIHVGR